VVTVLVRRAEVPPGGHGEADRECTQDGQPWPSPPRNLSPLFSAAAEPAPRWPRCRRTA